MSGSFGPLYPHDTRLWMMHAMRPVDAKREAARMARVRLQAILAERKRKERNRMIRWCAIDAALYIAALTYWWLS